MKRKLVIAMVAFVSAIGLWGAARALPQDDEAPTFQHIIVESGVPVRIENREKLPKWREISDNLGILLRDDERFGYRGRLFVKAGEGWEPVAVDGIDSFGFVPLKR